MNREKKQSLREKAEAMLNKVKAANPDIDYHGIEEALEELNIHQIELELQNQELQDQQETIERQKSTYFNLFNLAPVSYLKVDRSERILEANHYAHRLLSEKRLQLQGKDLKRFIGTNSQDAFYLFLREVAKSKSKQETELGLCSEEGNTFYALMQARYVVDEKGGKGYYISFQDITQRLNAEDKVVQNRKRIEAQNRNIKDQVVALKNLNQQLKESKGRFRAIFEQASDMIFIVDNDQKIQHTSNAVTRLLGYSQEELKGMEIKKICPAQTHETYQRIMHTINDSGAATFESQVSIKGGKLFPVDVSLGSIHTGSETHFLVIMRDISERKRSERILQESEMKFRSFIEQSQEGIALADNQGRIIEWNKASETITGISQEEALQRFSWEINYRVMPDEVKALHPLAEVQERTLRMLGEDTHTLYNNRFTKAIINQKDGQPRHISQIYFPVEYYGKRYLGSVFYDETEKAEAQRQLADNEALFRQIGENMNDMVAILDAQGRYVWTSPSHKRILGYSAEELKNIHPISILHPEDKERMDALLGQKVKSPNSTHEHYRVRRKDNKYIWVEANGSIITDDNNARRIIINARDITLRYNALQSLRENKELLDNVIENATVGIRLVDADNKIRMTNKFYACFNESTQEELEGEPCYQYLSYGDGTQHAYQELRKRFEQDAIISTKLIEGAHTAKRYYLYNAVPFRDEQNNIIGILETFKDVTDLENTKRHAQRLLHRLNMAIEVGNLGWWEWHIPSGHLDFADKKVTMLGYKREDFAPDVNSFIDIIHPDELEYAKQRMHDHLEGRADMYQIEYRLQKKQGGYKWFYDQGRITDRGEDGTPLRMIGVIYDIDSQVKRRQELKQAKRKAEEANRIKSEFLANMSHEIRTPLNSVIGFAEILKADLANQPRFKNYLDGINTSAKNLLNLINDILDISKIEAGRLQISRAPTHIIELLQEIKQVFSIKSTEANINIVLETDPRLPEAILVDATRLRQVLFNLVGNAVKFTHKGEVRIQATVDRRTEDTVDLTIHIKDTGIGISPEHKELIFEPFRQPENQTQRTYGGTGLGLTITRRLVEMLNGKIWLESEPGKGSCFSFTLKDQRITQAEKVESVEDVPEDVRFHGQHILLAEDDANNREVIQALLEKHNLHIEEARDGEETLQKAFAHTPDLILLDVLMPRKNGVEVAKTLRESSATQHVPIIAATALAVRERIDEMKALADDIIFKPIARGELLHKLMHFLGHDRNVPQKPEKKGQNKGFDPQSLLDIPLNPGLKEDYLKSYAQYYDLARKSYSLNNIRKFASEMLALAEKYKLNPLEKYARQLDDYAKNFKFEQIVQLLNDFSKFEQSIKQADV